MLTLTKFPNKYVLDENGKRIRCYYIDGEWYHQTNDNYPCKPARRWMRDQAKRGLTAKEIWEKCENTDWISWILRRVDKLKYDFYAYSGYSPDELRSMVKWRDVRNALIKHGWR